jgi:hypothetical protein
MGSGVNPRLTVRARHDAVKPSITDQPSAAPLRTWSSGFSSRLLIQM